MGKGTRKIKQFFFFCPKTNLGTFSYLGVYGSQIGFILPFFFFFFKPVNFGTCQMCLVRNLCSTWDKIIYVVQHPNRKKWGKEYKQALFTQNTNGQQTGKVFVGTHQRKSNLKQIILTLQFNKVYSTLFCQHCSDLDVLCYSVVRI